VLGVPVLSEGAKDCLPLDPAPQAPVMASAAIGSAEAITGAYVAGQNHIEKGTRARNGRP